MFWRGARRGLHYSVRGRYSSDVLALLKGNYSLNLSRGHCTGYKKRLDGRKQSNTCTSVPVRKGTVVTSCGLGYTIPYHLERNNTGNISMV